ncbi:MAG TPA: zinc-finger domain-containing protein [Alphaproteobacteria bacterium]|nr:zinc-finger domain-containing protein [Alphaproteobacteria bacterium]
MSDVTSKPAVATEPPEIIYVASTRVACDGGQGALGHPRVYLEMGEEDRVECPYCDRLYVYRPDRAR